MQEKYGFVYIWFDKQRKMFYIGCRWGYESDGYICSSNRMRLAYYRRPQDFKRKILARVYTNRTDLLEEEFKWLSLIKKKELGKRYYNIRQHHFGHWINTPKADLIKQKNSNNVERAKKVSAKMKGKPKSAEHKEKIRQARLGKKHTPETIEKIRMNSHVARDYNDSIFKAKMSYAARNRSVETRKKISDITKRRRAEGTFGRGIKSLA